MAMMATSFHYAEGMLGEAGMRVNDGEAQKFGWEVSEKLMRRTGSHPLLTRKGAAPAFLVDAGDGEMSENGEDSLDKDKLEA
jgi:hypothetical protein